MRGSISVAVRAPFIPSKLVEWLRDLLLFSIPLRKGKGTPKLTHMHRWCTCKHNYIQTHIHTNIYTPTDSSLSPYLCKLNQMIFRIAIKQSLFCLAGHTSRTPPTTTTTTSPQPYPPPKILPAFQPHNSRISFPPRIPLKRCHVGWRQSAEMLLRYSCSFSKAPNSIYGHIYYHVCQWLKGSFIIKSTHLIWSQQAASLGQYALYYTVRASQSTEEKENMGKQKTR